MQVRVVRDSRPGCAPDCLEWIEAEGKITTETHAAFEHVLRSLGERRLPIFIDSPGGSVEDAMVIGRFIRARHLDVVVTRTLVDPCADAALCGRPAKGAIEGARSQSRGAICASACTLVLAAGARRSAPIGTGLGVHQIVRNGTRIWKKKIFRTMTKTVDGVDVVERIPVGEHTISVEHVTTGAPQATYAHVESYLEEMGIKPSLMSMMLATPPTGVHWLSRDEARSAALVTDVFDGDDLARQALRMPPRQSDVQKR